MTEADIQRRSIAKYKKRAAYYDQTCGPTWPIRVQTIADLRLQPGDSVLDVGCGTGLSLELLRCAVGQEGNVYGFDQSPEMFIKAEERVRQAGWGNVHLYRCDAQSLNLPGKVQAVLFHYTHDILRSESAIQSILSQSAPGARVAIAGIKYFPRWLSPLNLWVYLKNYGYNGSPGDLYSPWDKIAPYLLDLKIQTTQWGMGYRASGRLTSSTAISS